MCCKICAQIQEPHPQHKKKKENKKKKVFMLIWGQFPLAHFIMLFIMNNVNVNPNHTRHNISTRWTQIKHDTGSMWTRHTNKRKGNIPTHLCTVSQPH